MAWGSETALFTAASVTTEQFANGPNPSNPGSVQHVEIEADFPVTPTDDLIVSLYGTLDGTNFDDTPIMQFTIDNGTDPNQVSFVVSGLYRWRVGVQRSGSTDTITVNGTYRDDGVNL